MKGRINGKSTRPKMDWTKAHVPWTPEAPKPTPTAELRAIVVADSKRKSNMIRAKVMGPTPSEAYAAQVRMQDTATMRGLACFKCGKTETDWAKVAISKKRGPWKGKWYAVCVACVRANGYTVR